MRLQLLSDLHLETESFEPEPAPDAELLVLAGDIDSRWEALARFRDWPVPVLFIAGNHEYDQRELTSALPALRHRCEALGLTMLERESRVIADRQGRRIRFVATTRWCDFDLFGAAVRDKAQRAAAHYLRLMAATRGGRPFDAAELREEALACRAWLEAELAPPHGPPAPAWDATVVLTHYAPSVRSADPRYGRQPGTAGFCNADDDLLPHADVWIHGHLHCRHDYRVAHARGSTRVVCNPRGHSKKGEPEGYDGRFVLEV